VKQKSQKKTHEIRAIAKHEHDWCRDHEEGRVTGASKKDRVRQRTQYLEEGKKGITDRTVWSQKRHRGGRKEGENLGGITVSCAKRSTPWRERMGSQRGREGGRKEAEGLNVSGGGKGEQTQLGPDTVKK